MALVTFVDDNPPYLNAQNLNNNFNECLDTGTTLYTGNITTSGSYSFVSGTNASDYRFVIVEIASSAAASQRAYCIVPSNKLIGTSSMWVSSYTDGVMRSARISLYPTYLSVLSVSSGTQIISVRGIK